MLFGSKVQASVTRSDMSGTTTILPASDTDEQGNLLYPFTVRKFMGEIKQSLQPMMYGNSSLFGADIAQLRRVFADWPGQTTSRFPIMARDQLHLPEGTYPIAGAKYYEGSHIEIYITVQPLAHG